MNSKEVKLEFDMLSDEQVYMEKHWTSVAIQCLFTLICHLKICALCYGSLNLC